MSLLRWQAKAALWAFSGLASNTYSLEIASSTVDALRRLQKHAQKRKALEHSPSNGVLYDVAATDDQHEQHIPVVKVEQ